MRTQTDDYPKLPQTKKDDVLNFKQNLAKTNTTLYKNVENAEKHNRYERFLSNNRTRYTTLDEKKARRGLMESLQVDLLSLEEVT